VGISYIASGSLAQGTDTITPAYPAGVVAGQLGVLQVVSAHPDEATPSTPNGWTRVGTFSGGGGTFGLNTGARRLTWFVRELGGSDAQPTVSIPSATGSAIGGRISVLSRSTGVGWLWSASFGEDTSSGTGFSAACSSTVTFRPGDFCLLGYGWNTQTASTSARAAAASGITFNTATSHLGDAITSGDGARLTMAESSVTSGTAAATPTVTATLTAAATGVGGVLRLREDVPKGVITATPQTVFPPRNIVSVTEMLAGDVVSATLYRETDAAGLVELRASSAVDVTGEDALVRVDGEQPFGVEVAYAARLVDSLGDESLIFSGPITSTVDSDVISDAVRGVGSIAFIEDWPDFKRTRDATTMNVGGRYVTVGRPRSKAQSTITVSVDTNADRDALDQVLNGLTEGVLLIRKQVTNSRVDGYMALIDDDEKPDWQTEHTEWDLNVAESEAWPDSLEAAGFTLADLADNFTTLQDLADFFAGGTLLDVALYDFGG
jgi:hypothetical protein